MSDQAHISFEFFPPKGESSPQKIMAMCRQLARYQPAFYSVTYGAGASTTSSTRQLVETIQANGLAASPHLSLDADQTGRLVELLEAYRQKGIKRVVALRGDLTSGVAGVGQLTHANELVALIRDSFSEYFDISVAAYPEIHPEAESYDRDIYWLKEKICAGANRAITKYFYDPDAYFRFVEQTTKQGIDAPIIPGIMPLTNYHNLVRFSDRCGAEIPRWLRQQLRQRSHDIADLTNFGLDVVSELCHKLLEGGAPGLHFYTMNKIAVVDALCQNLSLDKNPE